MGSHYVIRNAAWNANVPAGGEASFGFEAAPGASGTAATGFVLNGAPDLPPQAVPTLSIDDATITEGDGGSTELSFTVRLSQAASAPVTVDYSTANGTAAGGIDYSAISGTFTFAPGETTKIIGVLVIGDAAVEANETFTVSLSGASGATIADGSATGTIVNDDAAPPPPPPPLEGGRSLDYGPPPSSGEGYRWGSSRGDLCVHETMT